MTKLILRKAERIKIRLVTIINRFRISFMKQYIVIQETFGREILLAILQNMYH